MAYDRQSIKLSWMFVDSSSDETAVTSCSISGVSTSYDAVTDLAAITAANFETLLTAMGTLLASAQGRWGDYSDLVSMKAAALDTDGHYLTEAVVHDRTGSALGGTLAYVPPQMAVVLSLWSGASLGSGNYGRMYLPHFMLSQQTGKSVAGSTDQGNFATHAATFLQAVNTVAGALSTGCGLRILSNSTVSKGVASVRVGCVNDTQRRRRRGLSENLSSGTVAL